MDNLARETMLARQAGMTYGKWKALQKPKEIAKKTPDGWKICPNCGKAFSPRGGQKIYCEPACRLEYNHEKYKEKLHEKYLRRKARKEQEREEEKRSTIIP